MPLPSPTNKQNKQKFVGSCISKLSHAKEFNDQKQRIAVCYSQWKRKKETKEYIASSPYKKLYERMEIKNWF